MNELKIEYLSPKLLIEYENNPRINDGAIDYVANSIKEFGFKNPIIIDKDNIIIAGHTRLKASQRLGLEKVPCIRVHDLTEEQINSFRLVDNKTSEFAEWDWEKLNEELDNIDLNMTIFGFEEMLEEVLKEDEEENTDPIEISDKLSIIIECDTQEELEQTFEWLQSEGYKCKLSTL